MTVTAIRLDDGTEVAAAGATCEGCGNPLAEHSCGGSGGGTGSVTYTRRSGPRAPVTPGVTPTCVHCKGRLHQNLSSFAVDSECQARMYGVEKGLMASPFDRIPAHLGTPEGLAEIGEWGKTIADYTYGKMVSAAGGAGTYAGLKPKTGRRKKAVAAPVGSRIEDMAEGEDIDLLDEEEATAPVKPKKSRKSKGLKVSKLTVNDDDTTSVESVDLEEAVAEATNGQSEEFVPLIVDDEAVEAFGDSESARTERAERRRQRKQERQALLK